MRNNPKWNCMKCGSERTTEYARNYVKCKDCGFSNSKQVTSRHNQKKNHIAGDSKKVL